MDTTAAAELGMGMVGGAGVDSLGYPTEEEDEEYGESPNESRGHGRPCATQSCQKKMRIMSQGGGYANCNAYFQGDDFNNGLSEETWYGTTSWQGGMASAGPSMNPSSHATQVSEGGKGRGAGSIFYKTKLCSKFRLGNCPFDSRCNFAHGMEELRKPPQGWENFVAAQDGVVGQSRGNGGSTKGAPDVQKFKTRPCKFFKEGSCPYGDRCTFLHDISTGVSENGSSWSGRNQDSFVANRPPNWKTRICNQWESSGQCSFGERCHFAHGAGELQKYGSSDNYTKHSNAAIYDCGFAWPPNDDRQTKSIDWTDDQDNQYSNSSQFDEDNQYGSSKFHEDGGFSAYGSYAYHQLPYNFRPHMLGYGLYPFQTGFSGVQYNSQEFQERYGAQDNKSWNDG